VDSVPADADARDAALTAALRRALAIAAAALLSALLWADGGTVLLRKESGPYVVSLFATPTPLRVGTADLSVMVQKTADQSAVLDATVMVRMKKAAGDNVVEVAAPASHAKATNKLLYAAQLTLPSEGLWHVSVDVSAAGKTVSVLGEANVSPPQTPLARYWPYFAIVPLIALIFAMNQWLKRKREIRSPRARS
jgi:hypothetical protein